VSTDDIWDHHYDPENKKHLMEFSVMKFRKKASAEKSF
jgi:hypothetical protein